MILERFDGNLFALFLLLVVFFLFSLLYFCFVLLRKTRPNERLCTLCDSKTIEDEIHFVCQCKKYEIYRKELYDRIIMHNEQFILFNEKGKFIYNLKNKWKNFGRFMESAWTCRQNTMYSG